MKKDQILNPEIFRFINDIKQKEEERKNMYGEVKPIIQAKQKGTRVMAIGNKVIVSNKWRTFPDFLYDYLLIIFGGNWLMDYLQSLIVVLYCNCLKHVAMRFSFKSLYDIFYLVHYNDLRI